MTSLSLIFVIAFTIVARSTELSFFPDSECRWDKGTTLDCSSTGITVVWPPGISRSFWPHSVGLWRTMKHINLSNNTISRFHLRTLYNYSLLETLNLSNNHIYSVSLKTNRLPGMTDAKVSTGFLTSLKILLLSGNQLKSVPEGLQELISLQTLSLSANRIEFIHQDDFANCTELRTIDLGDNRIYKIHPDAFRDTKNLQLLSLRSNAMITITWMIFMYAHVTQAEVDLSYNPWACDCRMRNLKHFISIQSKDVGKMWNVTCNSPPRTKGQHLITINFPSTCVKPMDSTNARPEMIVAGKETLLSCDVPDSFGTHKVRWWTPKGWIFEDDQYSTHYIDHMKNLVLTLPDRSDEGLYICVSDVTQNRILYQVYVHTRESVPIRRTRNTLAERAQGRTQGEFTVAVCLSVIITFIVAFCLGLFARPFIENLWKKQCKSRCSKKQNSTTVYDNEGFTDERDWCSTHEYVGKNKSRDASETESSSGSSTPREDKVAVNVTGNHLEDSESQELYYANPTLPKSEENITRNHQCSRDIPAHTSSQLQRRGTYTITDDNDQGSDGEIVTLNAGLHKTKDGTAWNTDKLLYENVIPQLTPKSEATIKKPAAPTTITEIVKSPKTLFSSRNLHQSPSPETTQEGAAYHADDDMPTAENHKPLSTRHSGSIQNKQYSHTAVVHKRNRERITTPSDTSSTDDGSIFSFSISNSLSETTDFPDLPSDDEKVDVQQHSTAEVPGGNMMPSHSAGEHTSDSSSNLSTPTVSRQTTPTLTKESEMKTVSDLSKSQSNKGTDNHLTGSDLDASNLYDKTNIQPIDPLNYSSDNLSDTSSFSKKSEGNSEVVINHDWSQRSNNKIHLDRATDYSDLSTSSEYTAEFPDEPDVPHHLQIPTNDVTDAGQNPCKNEAVLYWLETATSGNATNESLIPPVISNREDLLITTSAKEDLLNINSHEGKTMQIVADSSDTLNITQPKTYKNVEYDANTKTPFMGLDKYIGGSVNPLPVYMQMEAPTTKSTDNSGAYFVKRRKVFDAFSASLNTGENLI